jgi:hypothetical protein
MHNDYTKEYLGRVEAINDPKFEGRCRVRVFTLFDDIDVIDLPWAVPYGKPTFFGQDARAGSISIPKVGAIVRIKFNNGDIYAPEYSQVQEIGEDIKQELKKGGKKYEGAHFILFDGDEEIKFWFDREIGLQMELKESFIRIDNSNSHILIEHKDNLSSISMEGNVIRLVSDSEVHVTSTSLVDVTSQTVNIKGQVNVGADPSGGDYVVLGRNLEGLLTQMAAAIDAKLPCTPGATTGIVNSNMKYCMSPSVQASCF